VRSAQVNLNRLLASQLGNLAAFEATQLPAPAFAMAALGTDTVGWFQRNAGLHLADARALLGDLPTALSLPLYRFQAHRLDNALRKVGCRARMRLAHPCA
jgi:hypothetical protein